MILQISACVARRSVHCNQLKVPASRQAFHCPLVLRTAVYLTNLPPTITVTALEQLYGTYGKIKDISLRCSLVNGGTATVEMVNWAAAHKAIHETNGAIIDGNEVKVIGLYTNPPADSPVGALASGVIVNVDAKPIDPEQIISPPTVKIRDAAYYKRPKIDNKGHYDPESYVTHDEDVYEPYSCRTRPNNNGDSTKESKDPPPPTQISMDSSRQTPHKEEKLSFPVSTKAQSSVHPLKPPSNIFPQDKSLRPNPSLFSTPSLTETKVHQRGSSFPPSLRVRPAFPTSANTDYGSHGAPKKGSTLKLRNPPSHSDFGDKWVGSQTCPHIFPSTIPTFGAGLPQSTPLGYPLLPCVNPLYAKAEHPHTTSPHAKSNTLQCSPNRLTAIKNSNGSIPTMPSSTSPLDRCSKDESDTSQPSTALRKRKEWLKPSPRRPAIEQHLSKSSKGMSRSELDCPYPHTEILPPVRRTRKILSGASIDDLAWLFTAFYTSPSPHASEEHPAKSSEGISRYELDRSSPHSEIPPPLRRKGKSSNGPVRSEFDHPSPYSEIRPPIVQQRIGKQKKSIDELALLRQK